MSEPLKFSSVPLKSSNLKHIAYFFIQQCWIFLFREKWSTKTMNKDTPLLMIILLQAWTTQPLIRIQKRKRTHQWSQNWPALLPTTRAKIALALSSAAWVGESFRKWVAIKSISAKTSFGKILQSLLPKWTMRVCLLRLPQKAGTSLHTKAWTTSLSSRLNKKHRRLKNCMKFLSKLLLKRKEPSPKFIK